MLAPTQEECLYELLSEGTLTTLENGATRFAPKDAWHTVAFLKRLQKAIVGVSISTGPTFLVESEASKPRLQRVVSDADGGTLMVALRGYPDFEGKEPIAKHEFDPYLKLFFDLKAKLNPRSDLLQSYSVRGLSLERALALSGQLNSFVNELRGHVSRPEFQRAARSFRGSARKTERSALSYKDALFGVHNRLVVIRVDLSYQKEFCPSGGGPDLVDFQMARKHKGQFLKYLNQTYKDTMKGYIWKMEFGWQKGFAQPRACLLRCGQAS